MFNQNVGWHSIDIWLTLNGWLMVDKFWPILQFLIDWVLTDYQPTINQLLTECWLTIDWVLTKCQLTYRSSIAQLWNFFELREKMAEGLCNKISGFLLCLKYILILLPSQSYRNSKTPTRQNKLHLERIMMIHIFMRWYQTCTCSCQHLGLEIFCKTYYSG